MGEKRIKFYRATNPLCRVESNDSFVTFSGYKFHNGIEYSLYKKNRVLIRDAVDEPENHSPFTYKREQKFNFTRHKNVSFYDSISGKLIGHDIDNEDDDEGIQFVNGKNLNSEQILNDIMNGPKLKQKKRKPLRKSRKHHHNEPNLPKQVINTSNINRDNVTNITETCHVSTPFNKHEIGNTNRSHSPKNNKRRNDSDDIIKEEFNDYYGNDFDNEENIDIDETEINDEIEKYYLPNEKMEVNFDIKTKPIEISNKKRKRKISSFKTNFIIDNSTTNIDNDFENNDRIIDLKPDYITSLSLNVTKSSLEVDLNDLIENYDCWFDDMNGEMILMFDLTRNKTINNKCFVLMKCKKNCDDSTRELLLKINGNIEVDSNDLSSIQLSTLNELIQYLLLLLDHKQKQSSSLETGSTPRYMVIQNTNDSSTSSSLTTNEILSYKTIPVDSQMSIFRNPDSKIDLISQLIMNYDSEWTNNLINNQTEDKKLSLITSFIGFEENENDKNGEFSKLGICLICYDSLSGDELLKQCNCGCYGVCHECVTSQLICTIESGNYKLQKIENNCPNCKSNNNNENENETDILFEFNLPLIFWFVHLKRYIKRVGVLERNLLQNNDEMFSTKSCNNCRAILLQFNNTTMMDDRIKLFDCSWCNLKSICIDCGKKCHWPCNCGDIRKFEKQMDQLGDSSLLPQDPSEIKIKGRPCPKCEYFITKDGGCPHMSCKCGANFCWTCGDFAANHNLGTFPCQQKQKVILQKHTFSSADDILNPSSIRSRYYCESVSLHIKQHPKMIRRFNEKLYTIYANINTSEQNLNILEIYLKSLRFQETIMIKLNYLNKKSNEQSMNYYKTVSYHIRYYQTRIELLVDDLDSLKYRFVESQKPRFNKFKKNKVIRKFGKPTEKYLHKINIKWFELKDICDSMMKFIELQIKILNGSYRL